VTPRASLSCIRGQTRQEPGKNEAPRAAQPANRRTTRGDSFEEGPPSIDHPVLPFVPTNVIARRSLRSGGRFRVSAPLPRSPGAPLRMATRFPSPVARLGSTSRWTTLYPDPASAPWTPHPPPRPPSRR